MILVILFLITGCMGSSPRCTDENGNAVDWFYLYKLPKDTKHSNPLVKRGMAYMYITSATVKQGWTMSKTGIKNMNSMPARTLAPIYEDLEILALVYNDQPPVPKKTVLKTKTTRLSDLEETIEKTLRRLGNRRRYKRAAIYTTQRPITRHAYSKPTTWRDKENMTTINSRTTKPNNISYKSNLTTLWSKTKPTKFTSRGTSSTFLYRPYQTTETTAFVYKVYSTAENKFSPASFTSKDNPKNFAEINIATLANRKNGTTRKAKRIATTSAYSQRSTINASMQKTAQTTITIKFAPTTAIVPEAVKPLRKVSPKGFTKGIILADNTTGVWIVHSVAKFPPRPHVYYSNATYSFPVSGTKFGQSFLCVTVATATLNQIALQLKYKEPLVVYHNIPENFKKKLPNFVDIVNNKTVDEAPWYRLQTFKSLAGKEFLSLAKNGKLKADLYSGLVANNLNSDLYAESWLYGPGALDSECSDSYQVYNVDQVKFGEANIMFTSMSDQSKWTVTASLSSPKSRSSNSSYWICVGDTNRVAPQVSRGGGAVCTSEPILWEHFAQLITSIKPCMTSLKYNN